MARRDYKTQKVDPQMREVWERALRSPVELKLDNRSDFQRLRFRLYDTRAILKAQEDPLFDQISHLSIHCQTSPDKKYFLQITPSDAAIKSVLEKAGFTGTKGSISDDDLDPTK